MREVRRSPRFRREFEAILREVPRADEALRGLEHVVARNPESSMAVPDRPAYRQRPIHPPDRSFTILFTFDDESVTLLALREVPGQAF